MGAATGFAGAAVRGWVSLDARGARRRGWGMLDASVGGAVIVQATHMDLDLHGNRDVDAEHGAGDMGAIYRLRCRDAFVAENAQDRSLLWRCSRVRCMVAKRCSKGSRESITR